jgi:hypothetical protein
MHFNTLNVLRHIFIGILLKWTGLCFSQQSDVSEIEQNQSILLIGHELDSILESDFILKNGRVFVFDYPRAKGHPFFMTNSWIEGKLTLKGKLYDHIPLLFDSFHDQLICAIKNKKGENVFIKLNEQSVIRFNIGEHIFINSNSQEELPQHGFYELVYDAGDFRVFAKWIKKYLDSNTLQYSGVFDDRKPVYHVLKNGKVKTISSKHDFFSIYGAKKNEIKSFMKKNNIKLYESNNQELFKLFQFLKDFAIL